LSSFEKFYILLVARENNIFLNNNSSAFKNLSFKNADEVIQFLKKSNLINLFVGNRKIDFNNYIYGVEVGLDSNSRKNRYGTNMENQIQKILEDNKVKFDKQIPVNFIKNKNGTIKCFDFKFSKNNKDYYLECNFYNSSGSKLSEVTNSYIDLNKELKKQNYEFV